MLAASARLTSSHRCRCCATRCGRRCAATPTSPSSPPTTPPRSRHTLRTWRTRATADAATRARRARLTHRLTVPSRGCPRPHPKSVGTGPIGESGLPCLQLRAPRLSSAPSQPGLWPFRPPIRQACLDPAIGEQPTLGVLPRANSKRRYVRWLTSSTFCLVLRGDNENTRKVSGGTRARALCDRNSSRCRSGTRRAHAPTRVSSTR
eukprot:18618-Prymnesium_polylepis.1